MLVRDETGSRTVYLSLEAGNLPLLDDFADLVICRNALDHMPDPAVSLKEIGRVLTEDGALFISVDIGGEPTPDEPTVFSVESLRALLQERFDVVSLADHFAPHSAGRLHSVRAVARKKPRARQRLNKDEILRAYEDRLPPNAGATAARAIDGGGEP
jgi:SAM-dependent methyltransferase